MNQKPILALDCDGVLLDYSLAYAQVWQKATGYYPVERDSHAYFPMDRWEVEKLTGLPLQRFRNCFDESFWSSIPPIQGAVRACQRLVSLGYELVCVTALEPHFGKARLRNLLDHGFPIERVMATSHAAADVSPKANALNQLMPRVFVDDYLPYMRGINNTIHKALVLREPNGSPNVGSELSLVNSTHQNLEDFVDWYAAHHV